MNKTRNYLFNIFICAFVVGVFLLVFFMIFGIEPFGNMSLVRYDAIDQIYPFLCVLHDKLKNGESLFYSWRSALGDGFLPTYFYYLSSPFNLLVIFVSKEYIRSFMNIMILLKLVLSSAFFSCFLTSRNEKSLRRIYIIPLSCAYALSGFVLGYFHESMWLDSYMILPLIVIGYERMKKDKKPILYILSLVYSSLCSFYITYIIGLFLVIWFLLDEHKDIKDFLKEAAHFAFTSLLAIGMTALSIIVSYSAIMKTHAGDEPDIHFGLFGSFFNIFKYQFPFSVPINVSYSNNLANIYSGIFCVCFLFFYLFSKNTNLKSRIKRVSLILFLLICMNEAVLNFVWHGFHYQLCIPNRFSFIFIFVMLLTAYETLTSLSEIRKPFVIGMIISMVFPMICYFFVDFDSFLNSKTVLIISLIAVVIYSLLFVLQNMTNKAFVIVLLTVVMLCEIFSNAAFSLSYDLTEVGEDDKSLRDVSVLSAEVESKDDGFYRSKLVGTDVSNPSSIIGFNGISSYNSMMNNDILRFAEKTGYFITDVALDENGGYEPLDDILGVKYYYLKNETFLDDSIYECVGNKEDSNLYKNKNALSLGYAVKDDTMSFELEEHDVIGNINECASAMTGCDDILIETIPEFEYMGDGYDVQYADTDYLYCQLIPNGQTEYMYFGIGFKADEAGLYNMYMNYSDYGIVSIYVNGELRRYENTSFGGMLNLGKIEKGDIVYVFVQPEEAMADGYENYTYPLIELRFLMIDMDQYAGFLECCSKNQMSTSFESDSRFIAEISLDKDQMIFTSIPYDESWHVFENGKEIKKEKTLGTFIGLNIGEGHHSLEFKYIPEGFYLGLIISIISWIIFSVYLVLKLRKHSKDTASEENE